MLCPWAHIAHSGPTDNIVSYVTGNSRSSRMAAISDAVRFPCASASSSSVCIFQRPYADSIGLLDPVSSSGHFPRWLHTDSPTVDCGLRLFRFSSFPQSLRFGVFLRVLSIGSQGVSYTQMCDSAAITTHNLPRSAQITHQTGFLVRKKKDGIFSACDPVN
jgi:hypothetical protein